MITIYIPDSITRTLNFITWSFPMKVVAPMAIISSSGSDELLPLRTMVLSLTRSSGMPLKNPINHNFVKLTKANIKRRDYTTLHNDNEKSST